MRKIEITREDGRSNAQVILDYVKGAEAGRIFGYEEFASALNKGARKKYSKSDVRSVVTGAFVRLLSEQQRTLKNMRGIGYRLAHANDHMQLALDRKRRADVQLRRGVQTLQNVRWDEMDPTQRQVHEGTLLVVSALYQQQRLLERRQNKVEEAIANLRDKVDKVTA